MCFIDFFKYFGPKLLHVMEQVWLQNVILAATAIVGIWTIMSTARHEKRRATVDLVRDQTGDAILRAARVKFRTLRNAGANFPKLFDDETSQDFLEVREVLNAYEFMASGVREESFDEETYKRMYFTNVTRDWEVAAGLVTVMRRKHGGTLYQDFQWLADRWKSNPLKKDKQ